MQHDERTTPITRQDGDQDDQEPTRRLSMYEEEDVTRRLEVPPVPPWDRPEPETAPEWDRDRGDRSRRQWPTAFVLVCALLGLVLGVLGTFLLTGATQSEVDTLRSQLDQARQSIEERDTRIADLEQELEERDQGISIPLPGVDLPDLNLPDISVPDEEQRREILEQLQDQLRNLFDDAQPGN